MERELVQGERIAALEARLEGLGTVLLDLRADVGRMTRRIEKLENDQLADDVRARAAAELAARRTSTALRGERRFFAVAALVLTIANVLVTMLGAKL